MTHPHPATLPTLAELAAALPCNPDNLRADQASALLARIGQPLSGPENTENVGIFEALGRVLARDVVSPLNVPPHDNSAMDGYAFAGSALRAGAPLSLRVAATVLAGATWSAPCRPASA